MTTRPAATLSPDARWGQTSPKARILVVDDQTANIQVVGGALGKLGHEILPAQDGPTAFRRLAVGRVDLILLDLLMPGMDGCEVCRELKTRPEWRDIPVIFLSAADDKELIVKALETGGVDYVTKPFHHAELISRVHTQLALKAARDRLQELAEDKDELMGILAHDLKNHLGGMQMSAQLLAGQLGRSAPEEDRLRRLADNIARTSGSLLNFVKEFLANAAAERGLALAAVPVDVAAAVASVVDRYREAARQKGLGLDGVLAAEPAWAILDPKALEQIVENLVSNALKFSPSGTTVRVGVAVAAGQVECRIQDEGPGFTPEDRERMFERYRRLSARPTGGEPSTGLGLSIVRKLVAGLSGTLTCDSVPGLGTTFKVSFGQCPPPS